MITAAPMEPPLSEKAYAPAYEVIAKRMFYENPLTFATIVWHLQVIDFQNGA